jgi:hypothetical protein
MLSRKTNDALTMDGCEGTLEDNQASVWVTREIRNLTRELSSIRHTFAGDLNSQRRGLSHRSHSTAAAG